MPDPSTFANLPAAIVVLIVSIYAITALAKVVSEHLTARRKSESAEREAERKGAQEERLQSVKAAADVNLKYAETFARAVEGNTVALREVAGALVGMQTVVSHMEGYLQRMGGNGTEREGTQ